MMWSPASVCDSRVHSKLATASESRSESISLACSVLQSESANLSVSRPDFEPKKRASSAISAEGKAIVKHFEWRIACVE